MDRISLRRARRSQRLRRPGLDTARRGLDLGRRPQRQRGPERPPGKRRRPPASEIRPPSAPIPPTTRLRLAGPGSYRAVNGRAKIPESPSDDAGRALVVPISRRSAPQEGVPSRPARRPERSGDHWMRTSRLHPDRAAGGDRDHRRADRPAPARGPGGARGRAACPVHEQPQAARPGAGQLRERQRVLSDGGLRPVPPQPESRPGDELLRGAPGLHGAGPALLRLQYQPRLPLRPERDGLGHGPGRPLVP